MSVNEVALAEPFAPSVADEEVELRALCRALTLGEGFSLLFARCNQADHRRELIDKVRERLPDLNVQVIELREPITHLLDELRDRLTDTPPDAVFVLGLEYSLRTSDEARSSPLIANLNASRNSFPRVVRCPMVLWAPEYVVTAIVRGAPDFFSIRSGIYYFAAGTKDTIDIVQSLMMGDWAAVSNLTLSEKQERIESIRSLLADYEALPVAQRDLRTEGRLHYRLGSVFFSISSDDEALAEFDRSLRIAEKIGLREGVASARYAIGNVHDRHGQYNEALKEYEYSQDVFRELGDREGLAGSLHGIGNLYLRWGRYAEAMAAYEKALSMFEEVGDHRGVAGTVGQMGVVYDSQGQYTEALNQYENALRVFEELEDRAGAAIFLHRIGNVRCIQGQHTEGLNAFERALSIAEELGDRTEEAAALTNMGIVFAATARYQEALDHFLRARAIYAQLRSRPGDKTDVALRYLRANWGASAFDAAWQHASADPVPDWPEERLDQANLAK